MNTCTVVGRIGKHGAETRFIQGSDRQFLSCTVAYEKKMPSGKSYWPRFKVMQFGKGLDELHANLAPGTLVCVTGEVELERPKQDGSGSHNLKILGRITVLDEHQANPPEPRPKAETPSPRETQPSLPVGGDRADQEEDDVPF